MPRGIHIRNGDGQAAGKGDLSGNRLRRRLQGDRVRTVQGQIRAALGKGHRIIGRIQSQHDDRLPRGPERPDQIPLLRMHLGAEGPQDHRVRFDGHPGKLQDFLPSGRRADFPDHRIKSLFLQGFPQFGSPLHRKHQDAGLLLGIEGEKSFVISDKGYRPLRHLPGHFGKIFPPDPFGHPILLPLRLLQNG